MPSLSNLWFVFQIHSKTGVLCWPSNHLLKLWSLLHILLDTVLSSPRQKFQTNDQSGKSSDTLIRWGFLPVVEENSPQRKKKTCTCQYPCFLLNIIIPTHKLQGYCHHFGAAAQTQIEVRVGPLAAQIGTSRVSSPEIRKNKTQSRGLHMAT